MPPITGTSGSSLRITPTKAFTLPKSPPASAKIARPAWSPDGKWIAYSTQLDPHLFQYATKHIAVAPSSGGEAKVLTKSLDRMATTPRFSPDGKSIYFIADDDGEQQLCLVNLADGKITCPISGRLMLDGYSVAKDGTIAASLSTMDRPFEIFSASGGKLTQLTHANDALARQI